MHVVQCALGGHELWHTQGRTCFSFCYDDIDPSLWCPYYYYYSYDYSHFY